MFARQDLKNILLTVLGYLITVSFSSLVAVASEPIKLHYANPRWLEYKDKAIVLVTSGEHYGAVINTDFDFESYLSSLEQAGLNYTRIFSGTYIEPSGAFGITRNDLAPAAGSFLAPWKRSDLTGYAGGGNKLDLSQFSPEYLTRMKAFLVSAAKHQIVVELTLFSSIYNEKQWAVNPLNSINATDGVAIDSYRKCNTTENGAMLEVQLKFVNWLVRELNEYDNLFYEIQNEPWSDNHKLSDRLINPMMHEKTGFPNAVEIATKVSVDWQNQIAEAIVEQEKMLPKKHLIAQNISNFALPVLNSDLVAAAKLLNFHYAYPEAVAWNEGWEGAIGFDESGFAGRDDATYRKQAWRFMLAGGTLFNNLDYSYSVGHESGNDTSNEAPGGGSKALRAQLKTLRDFMQSFDLENLKPDRQFVVRSPGLIAFVLSEPGQQYAAFFEGRGGGELLINLPKGDWDFHWLDPQTGSTIKTESVQTEDAATSLQIPDRDELALSIRRK